MTLIAHEHAHNSISDRHYVEMRDSVNQFFNSVTASGSPVFQTDVDRDELWQAYLTSFALEGRQYHNCNACRHFIQRFGGLVQVTPSGGLITAVWPALSAGNEYGPGLTAMARLAVSAKIVQPFVSEEKVLGTPKTGEWTHLFATPAKAFIYTGRVKAAHEHAAEKVQDFQSVRRALSEWSLAKLQEASTLLATGGLPSPEKVQPGLDWLIRLANTKAAVSSPMFTNVLWAEVTKAPAGFTHPRSGALGSLMDDLIAGMAIDQIRRRFSAVMNPSNYQRTTAAPTTGVIQQATHLLDKLGATSALQRRFARLDEVDFLWAPTSAPGKPVQVETKGAGIFDHLRPKDAATGLAPGALNAGNITWAKFHDQVLPRATCIEALIPALGNFAATLTAVDPDAATILAWDRLAARNPLSQYAYTGGTDAARWGLKAGDFVEVAGLMFSPAHRDGGMSHHKQMVTFVLPGAVDSKNTASGLFPEILHQDFQAVRRVIEAHSNVTPVQNDGGPYANGLRVENGGPDSALMLVVRVTMTGGSTVLYRIDRWN